MKRKPRRFERCLSCPWYHRKWHYVSSQEMDDEIWSWIFVWQRLRTQKICSTYVVNWTTSEIEPELLRFSYMRLLDWQRFRLTTDQVISIYFQCKKQMDSCVLLLIHSSPQLVFALSSCCLLMHANLLSSQTCIFGHKVITTLSHENWLEPLMHLSES